MRYTFFLCIGLALALWNCEKNDVEALGDGSKDFSLDGASEAGVGSTSGQAGDSTIQAGQLTAGEWNDLENWDFWKGLISKDTLSEYPAYWDFGQFARVSLLVRQANGNPAVDAEAILQDAGGQPLWQARTDNAGRAEFFPFLLGNAPAQAMHIKVSYQGQSFQLNDVNFYEGDVNELVLPLNGAASQAADVLFVFDATGSMADELEYIKVEINDIISRIRQENGDIAFRLGSVFYRDEGDEYVTRTSGLSSNFGQVADFINSQRADGGGDYPEAVHSALQKAIGEQDWQQSARARLLFLILDAPPHYDENVIGQIQGQIRLAAQKGVKVIPVTASGIDQGTEFLMRILAIASNGTYTFITDHSGIGNDHLEPTVGDYEVEFLNDLIVRLVGEYVVD